MHALARLTLMRLKGRGTSVTRVLQAMRLLDQSCLSMCEGQHLDLEYQRKAERGDIALSGYGCGQDGRPDGLRPWGWVRWWPVATMGP